MGEETLVKKETTEPATQPDLGLGFSQFLATQPATEGDGTGEGEEPPESAAPAPKLETAPEAKPEDETTPAEKVTEKPPEKKTELPAGPNWDSDDNPYRARATQLEKQYTDTRNWATQINQQNTDLQRQLEVIGKKIDGTYDPDADVAPQPSPDQIQSQGELVGKVRASIAVAEQMYGKDEVHKLLFADGAPYRVLEDSEPSVRARVLGAAAPALEAMRVLKEREFAAKYGNDPEAAKAKIREEAKAEWEKNIDALVDAKIKERLKAKTETAPSLGATRGAGTPDEKGGVPVHIPLSQLGNPGLA